MVFGSTSGEWHAFGTIDQIILELIKILTSLLEDTPKHSSSLPKRSESSTLSTTEILYHLEQLLQITETEPNYEESRDKAREYIVNALTTPSKGNTQTWQ